MFFQRSMSCHYDLGSRGSFFGESPGSACELPRPHDDIDADDDGDDQRADPRCDSGQTMAWNRKYIHQYPEPGVGYMV